MTPNIITITTSVEPNIYQETDIKILVAGWEILHVQINFIKLKHHTN
jgi:hypothetical protein